MSTRPLLVVSVDTEEDNWIATRDGVSVENIRELERLDRLLERHGVRPTYFTTYQVLQVDWAVGILRGLAASDRGEVGAHLHPWNTPPLSEALEPANRILGNLPPDLQRAKLDTLTALLSSRMGRVPTAFRAGRFGLTPATGQALADAGYLVDSSVTPYIDWGRYDAGPSFIGAPIRVYRFDPAAGVMATRTAGPIIEVPLSSGFTRFGVSRWPWLNRALSGRSAKAIRLPGFAARSGFMKRVILSPEDASLRQMLALSRRLLRSGTWYLHFFLHSPSLRPGLTPFTRTRADVERLYDTIDRYLDKVSTISPLTSCTVSEAAAVLDPAVWIPGSHGHPARASEPAPSASRGRRLLVVTYHYPPDGAVGGIRWAGLSKYLVRMGWEVHVVTAANGDQARDRDTGVTVESVPRGSTLNDLYNRHALRLRTSLGAGKERPHMRDESAGGLWRALRAEGAALIGFPDYGRGWIAPTARRVRELIREFRPDAVVSSGPPHSGHLAVLWGLRGSSVPWILDLRDPWAGALGVAWGPRSEHRSALARLAVPRCERVAVRRARCVVANTPELVDRLQQDYPAALIRCVPNGVDVERILLDRLEPYPGLAIAYVGTLYAGRDLTPVLRGLALFLERDPGAAATIRVAGHMDAPHAAGLTATVDALNLTGHVEFVGMLAPDQALELLSRSRVGVVLAQRQDMQVPAKLFELVGLGVTTLVVTEPGSATAREAARLNAEVIAPDDAEGIATVLAAAYAGNGRKPLPSLDGISYEHLARRMHQVLIGA